MPKKKILNVFISQPMNGRTEEEILKERKWVMQALGIANPFKKSWEIHVIDSYFKKNVPDHVKELRQPRLWHLGDSIKLLADADFMVLLNEHRWVAPGCYVEKEAADVYDIPVLQAPFSFDDLNHSLRSAMRLKNKLVYNK